MTQDIFSSGIASDMKNERARRAVKAFRAMQPGLSGYARAITGRREVTVELAQGIPRTDGTKIFFKPPIALGDETPHSRAVCERRDPDTAQQLCPACRTREEVLITIYHEIAHIVYGTFQEVTDEAKRKAVERAIEEAGTKYAARIKAAWDSIPAYKKNDYLNLSSLISPFLPTLVNVLEDARVDEGMFKARKGTRVMFDAYTQSIFRQGVEEDDGSVTRWADKPLNSQVVIGVFVLACGYDYEGWFHPDVEAVLADSKLRELVARVDTLRSAEGSYNLAFPILARLRELGFCRAPEEPEDDTPEEEEKTSDKAAGGEGSDEDEAEADDAEAGSDSDQNGDPQDSDGGSDRGDSDSSEGADGDAQPDGGGDSGDAGDPAADSDEDGGSDSESRDDSSEDAAGADGPSPDGEDGSDSSDEGAGDGEPSDEQSSDGGRGEAGGGVDEASDDSPSADDGQGELTSGEDGDTDGEDCQGEDSHQEGESEPSDDEADLDADGELDGEFDDDPIDTGADEGEGGATTDKPDYGTAEEALADVQVFSKHEAIEAPHTHDAASDDEAVDRAIIQGQYFEKPSANVQGVREHKYGVPYMFDGRNVSDAWEDLYGSNDYHRAALRRLGVETDLEIPESILGPALIEMRRTFSDNARASMERHLRSGKINQRVLGKRAWAGDDRLFQKKRLPGRKSYAVLIGIDISGSTVGLNLALAKRAAMAQAELCARAGIDFAVYAHTANGSGGDWRTTLWLDVYEIKAFDAPWNDKAKEALDKISSDAENLDGHTIEYYRKMIERHSATDKIILYYSDGKMPAANHDEELEILIREIAYCKSHSITLLGVGIRTDSPRRHGLDTVQVDDDSDISKVVRHLETALLHNR